MKRILLFLAISILVVYGLIAVLSIGVGSAKNPDDEMIVRYYKSIDGGELVKQQIVPLYNNSDDVPVTKRKKTKTPKTTEVGGREGLKFVGWVVENDLIGGGSYLPAGLTYNNSDKILNVYGEWTDSSTVTPSKNYVITFMANGGSGTMATQTFTNGTAQALRLNAFNAPSGKHFEGWALSPSGVVTYTNGQTITLDSSRTLYAKWSSTPVAVYTVTFIANGSYFGSQVFTKDVSQVLNGGNPTKADRTFVGWATSVDGLVYYNGYKIRVSSDITLYAVWRVN